MVVESVCVGLEFSAKPTAPPPVFFVEAPGPPVFLSSLKDEGMARREALLS
jgi:hypothetical protein